MSSQSREHVTRRRSLWWLLVAIVPSPVAVGSMIWLAQPWHGGSAVNGPAEHLFGVLIDIWVVLPYLIVGVLVWFGRRLGPVPWWLVVGYGAVMGVGGIWGYVDVVRSEGSTVVLGLLFFPVLQLAGVVLMVVAGLVIMLVGSRRRGSYPAQMDASSQQ